MPELRIVMTGLTFGEQPRSHENRLAGVAGGFGLSNAASQGGNVSQPPAWWLIAVVAGTVIAVAGLTALPARFGARRPVAEILQSEAP